MTRKRATVIASVTARYLTAAAGVPLSSSAETITGLPTIDMKGRSYKDAIAAAVRATRQPHERPLWVFLGDRVSSTSPDNIVVVMNLNDFAPLLEAWYESRLRKE